MYKSIILTFYKYTNHEGIKIRINNGYETMLIPQTIGNINKIFLHVIRKLKILKIINRLRTCNLL